MSNLAFQEHVLTAGWTSIIGATTNDIDNPNTQYTKKIKFLKALFKGDLNLTLGIDFSKASAHGGEHEGRMRGYAEQLWELVNRMSQGIIFDSYTKRARDVIDEVCEKHGGQTTQYCTRFGFFNTFRAPGPAKQGVVVQDDRFGKEFLKLQEVWIREESLLREAEKTAQRHAEDTARRQAEETTRRLINEERKRTEAVHLTTHPKQVAPVMGQPVVAVAEVVPQATMEKKQPEDPSPPEPAPPEPAQDTPGPKPVPDVPKAGKDGAWKATSNSSRPVHFDIEDEELQMMPTPKPPAPPRGPSPKPSEHQGVPPVIQLPKSVSETASDEATYGPDTIKEIKGLWTKAQMMGKKREIEYDAYGVSEPFRYRGWVIRTHKRGLTKAGTEPTTLCDSYFIAPNGKRFRSHKELDRAYGC
jgi:hypothetical protein